MLKGADIVLQCLRAEGVDWARFVDRTEGASPAYIKELLRKAVLIAAEAGETGAVSNATLESAKIGRASCRERV